MNLNFKNGFYEYKFGRKPKQWSIEMVHDLWCRTLDRSNKRRKDLIDCIDEIVNTITPEVNRFGEKEYRVYYNIESVVNYYKLSNSQRGLGMSYTRDLLKFEGNSAQSRDEKLTFILANQKAFELGEKMLRLEKLCSYQHYRVKEILSEMLQDELRKRYKEYDNRENMIIQISDKSYFVRVDSSHFPYKKFELLDEVKPDSFVKF